jgi:hypothetical protein
MSEYPSGVQRFVAGGVLGREGKAKRVFFIHTLNHASTGGTVTLHNSTSAASTVNVLWTHYGVTGSDNTSEIGEGVLFNQGCYVALSAGSGCAYAVIGYQEELI